MYFQLALLLFTSSLCLVLALPLEDSEVIGPKDFYIDGDNSFEHFEYIENVDDIIDNIEDIADDIEKMEVRGTDVDPKKCKEQLKKAQVGFKNCMKRGK